jgi:membrane-associated phospholipid phosphatase
LPLLALVAVFTYLRGISDDLGMPTWWQPQIRIEKFLFFGHLPTLWLQEHLKYATAQWWDVPVALVYMSFFIIPGTTAAVLWLRNRRDFYRWSTRYVTLTFVAFAVFALAPAAPPWAAARCTPGKIAGNPNEPNCMAVRWHLQHGGLTGLAAHPQPGASPWIQRIASRGLGEIHLSIAQVWESKGQVTFDPVASFPSLHAATALLFAIFMWKRVRRSVRVLLALYPAAMTFTLVYTGEHYVIDCLAGFAAAVLVTVVLARIERRIAARRPDDSAEPVLEPAA